MTQEVNAENAIRNLSGLIELDYDAVAVYEEAIQRIEDPICRAKLMEFLADHKQHIRALSHALHEEVGLEPGCPRAKRTHKTTRLEFNDLVGDKAIMKAIKSTTDLTSTKYEEAVGNKYPGAVNILLENSFIDKLRHQAWVEEAIGRLP